MSKRFEDFMKNNNDEFDEIEPSADLWSKIEARLDTLDAPKKREAKTFSLGLRAKNGRIYHRGNGHRFRAYIQSKKAQKPLTWLPLTPSMPNSRCIMHRWLKPSLTSLKQHQKAIRSYIRSLAAEIAKMDSTYKKLNNDLATSPNQERVLRAMIRNLQIQTEVLSQQLNVIEQFNETNKDQKDEIKNI
jgi:hypothetical protein